MPRQRLSSVENRLIQLAMMIEVPPHQACWPHETVEYKIYTMGQVCGGGAISDGGLLLATLRHGRDTRSEMRAKDTQRAVARLKRRYPNSFAVINLAFMDRPGHIISRRTGAQKMDIPEIMWRTRYQRGLDFVDGVLDSVVAMA